MFRKFFSLPNINLPKIKLGDLLSTPLTDIHELVQQGIAGLSNLALQTLDVRKLIDSGLTSLADLVQQNLLGFANLDQLKLDIEKLLSQYAFGAPTRIYINLGNGSFAGGVNLSSDQFITRSLAVGDVDGDHRLDIVAGNSTTGSRLYKNVASTATSVTFGPGTRISDIGPLTSVVLKDMDKDGDLDLVTGNFFGTTRLYLNNGSGSFDAAGTIISDFLETLALAVDDVDNDGDMDVIAANSKPALGAAGAGSAFDVGGDVQAYVASGATVSTNRSLFVTAHDETRVAAVARSDADNGAAGAALSAASPNIARHVAAHVDGDVTVATGSSLGTAQGVFIDATAHDDLLGYATGKATPRELGLAASAVIFRMNEDDSHVDSYIGSGASVTATNAASGVPLNIQLTASHNS